MIANIFFALKVYEEIIIMKIYLKMYKKSKQS